MIRHDQLYDITYQTIFDTRWDMIWFLLNISYGRWCEMGYNMIYETYDIEQICMILDMIWHDIWYEVWYTLRYNTWSDMMCDTRYDTRWYMMIYEVWYAWYMIWYTVRHMIWWVIQPVTQYTSFRGQGRTCSPLHPHLLHYIFCNSFLTSVPSWELFLIYTINLWTFINLFSVHINQSPA